MSTDACPFCGQPLPEAGAPTCPTCGRELGQVVPVAGPTSGELPGQPSAPIASSNTLPTEPPPAMPPPAAPPPPSPSPSPPGYMASPPTYPVPGYGAPSAPPSGPQMMPYPAPQQVGAPPTMSPPPYGAAHPYLTPAPGYNASGYVWPQGAPIAPVAVVAVPQRPRRMAPPRVQTTLVRGLAVGEAAALAAFVLAFALWSALNSFASSADTGNGLTSQLFQFIYGTHSLTTGLSSLSSLFTSTFGFAPDASTAATGLSYLYVQDLLVLLASLAPLALAASFWQALRRLAWERFGAVWFTAFLTSVWLLLLLACVVSAESFGLAALQGQPDIVHRTPFWAALWLIGLPGFIAVLLALALLSSLLGVAAAAAFARWPSPRPARPSAGTAPLPPRVVTVTLLVALLQVAAYALLHATLMKGTGVTWDWFPLGALLILAASALGTTLPDAPGAPAASVGATP